MTYFTNWERLAEEKGREEGKAEGRAEGIGLGCAKVLLALLEQRFGKVPESVRKRVDGATNAEIPERAGRILSAESPHDVFGG